MLKLQILRYGHMPLSLGFSKTISLEKILIDKDETEVLSNYVPWMSFLFFT